MNSYKELVTLGNGRLVIDAKTGACTFEGKDIDPVSIAFELTGWFKEDLSKHHIDVSQILGANLAADLNLTVAAHNEVSRSSFYIGKDRKPIVKGNFYKLEARFRSEIKTDEANYSNERVHFVSWPVGWPDT